MATNNILFSIIMPFYETVNYIQQTLDSIVQQNFDLEQVEVIIVDDGSKFDISNLVEQYRSKIKHLSMHKKQNGNWGSIINFVKEKHLAKGKYITVLDSDDLYLPNALSTVATYANNNDPDIITAKFYRWSSITNKRKPIYVHLLTKSRFFYGEYLNKKKHLLETGYSFPLVKFYKASIFYKIKFSLQENISFQDSVLFHLLVANSTSWQYVNAFLGLYRDDRPDSSSNNKWTENRVSAWIDTINNLDNVGATANAYMYCIYTQFRNSLEELKMNTNKKEIVLHKDFKMAYVPKALHPLALSVFKSIIKKMAKYWPIKLL